MSTSFPNPTLASEITVGSATAPAFTDHPVAVAVKFDEARLRLAIKRSEMLASFYSAERHAGADPLTANLRMHEFAKRLDAQPSYEVELDAIREIMELVS